jgi:hypothetical protein
LALLSDLVEAIAKVEDIDPATVGLIARYLREAGLIAMHGRGPSAARMSVTDATNLLIGVNATSRASNAPRVVKAYRQLEAFKFLSLSDPSQYLSRETLGQAIEQLLDGAGRGELLQLLGQELPWDLQEGFAKGEVHVDLTFRKSAPRAYLAMTELPPPDEVEPSAVDHWLSIVLPMFRVEFLPLVPRGPPPAKRKPTGDRVEDTTIGYPTLHAVGKLIA